MPDGLRMLVERGAEEGRERRVFGLVTARVTAINDDGSYELSYLSMGSDDASSPARVMAPGAGAERGLHFAPEKGDEVVVGFELGDTSLPIILGGVWNGESPRPGPASAPPDNDVRTLVTRSGHQLTFDDTPGREKVLVETQGGHELELDDGPGRSVTLRSAGGGEVEIRDADGSLTLRAPVRISLEAPSVSIRSSASVEMTAPAGIQLTTTGSVAASAVVIDGKPFGLHVHLLGPGTTGTVAP